MIQTTGQRGRLKRVLYLMNWDPSQKLDSGTEQALATARAFQSRGGLFLLAFVRPMKDQDVARCRSAGLICEPLDLKQFSWATLATLLSLIKRHDIEVVHWNLYHPLNPYLWFLTALKPHLLHFLTDHNSRPAAHRPRQGNLQRWVKKAFLRRYDCVLGVSDFVAQDLRQQGVWSNVGRYYHFVNTDRFKPDPAVRTEKRRKWDVEDRSVLLVVAHLICEKGVDVALRALVRLPPHVTLWIVGDGPERGALQALADRLGLRERVVFFGLQRNVEPYMQAADAFLCPSVWAEAAGLVLLEAASAGLPVIASRIGGIPEFVEDQKTGFLFPAGEDRALAERITELLENPERAHAMGQAGRNAALTHFSTERRLSELLPLYEDIPGR